MPSSGRPLHSQGGDRGTFMSAQKTSRPYELSARGLVLGVLITFLFTAANIYLGLKVGLTFATSIPAAVISMAVLSAFPRATILENNIVQTVASSAGTLSSIIFVLPGLVIVGWWSGFPFWTSFAVCVSGGTLGVLFTIPLRRALVTNSDLPYPEGVAAAEVLIVGSGSREGAGSEAAIESREGLRAIVFGSVASAGLAALTATRIAAGEIQSFLRLGNSSATGYDVSFSLALVGAGHLVGISVGMALLLGLVIAWGGAVPILTAIEPMGTLSFADHADHIWSSQVRFIGAGTIAVAALWSLGRLAGPLARGLIATVAKSRAIASATDDGRDRDLSLFWIATLTIACLALATFLLYAFLDTTSLAPQAVALTLTALPFILFGGFLIAAISGYMAGLIGASNSPLSGVGILSIVALASGLAAIFNPALAAQRPLVAFALFTTSIVFAVATISNDNLQDLKTGQLVGAAPWRQQIALIVGVLAGAAVIPPVLNLLAKAYGFAGGPHGAVAHPLPAPQANLISALARGVIEHNLDWRMIGLGVLLGFAVVALDETLGALRRLRLPPLAVGIAIYLPMSATLCVIVGAVTGHLYNRYAARRSNSARAQRLGVLVASGMIVGESLFGVLLAGLIVASSKDAPLALVPEDFAPANLIAFASFAALIAILYGWMMRRPESSAPA